MKVTNFLFYLSYMNYLAHAYLSFGKPEILTGNLIADFVKGKRQFDFSTGIQSGIRLHRAIDTFTDTHEATRNAKAFLTPACGRYSGAFTDVIFDHFLARDTRYFNERTLSAFTSQTYKSVRQFEAVFPEKFVTVFHYMQLHDWLGGYYYKENVAKAFRGLYYRAAYLRESGEAFEAFEQHYTSLKRYYSMFMPDLISYAADFIYHINRSEK